MPTIIYQGRRVSVTDAAARLIAAGDTTQARTRPLISSTQNTVKAQAPRAFFSRERREAGCAQLRAENAARRAFWAAQRT